MSRYSPTVAPEYYGTNGSELAAALAHAVQQRRAEQQADDAHRQAEIEAVRGGYRPAGAEGGFVATTPRRPGAQPFDEIPSGGGTGVVDTTGDALSRAMSAVPAVAQQAAMRTPAMPSSDEDSTGGGWGAQGPTAAPGRALAGAMAPTPAPAPASPFTHGGGAPGAFQPGLGGFAPAMPTGAAAAPAAAPAPGGAPGGPSAPTAAPPYGGDLAAEFGERVPLSSGGTVDLYAGERRQLAQHTLQQRFALAAAAAERDRKAAALRKAGVPEDKIAVALEVPSAASELFKPAPTTPMDERVAARVRELQGQGKSLQEANRIAALEHGRTPFTDPIAAHQANRLFDVEHPLPSTAATNKPTEMSAKAALVYPRAAQAAAALEPFFTHGMPARTAMGKVTGGNYFLSPEEQRANQAAETVSSAILRLESGAAISEHEVKEYAKQFLPQPGDSDEVRAAKRETLATQLERMRQAAAPTLSHDTPAPATAPKRFQGKAPAAAPAARSNSSSVGDVDLSLPPHVQTIDEMIRAGRPDAEIHAAMQAGVR